MRVEGERGNDDVENGLVLRNNFVKLGYPLIRERGSRQEERNAIERCIHDASRPFVSQRLSAALMRPIVLETLPIHL